MDILLVDDSQDTLDLMRTLLERRGHHVLSAPTGTQGLRLAVGAPLDLVLLDLNLPDISGMEFMARFSELQLTQRPHLVIVSGSAREAEKERALAAGANGFLLKPVRLTDLKEVLEEAEQKKAASGL